MPAYFSKTLLVFALAFGQCAFAQSSSFGKWLSYVGNHDISSRWNWLAEVQYRSYDDLLDMQQMVLRTGIGYALTDQSNLLLGYAFVRSLPYTADKASKIPSDEHRIFEQYLLTQKLRRVALLHRVRVEERFFEVDFTARFRYMLSVNFPLHRPTMQAKTLYLSASNEIFVQAFSSTFFDRNRIYGGIGYVFNPSLRLECGVMAQSTHQTTHAQLVLTFFNNLSFHRQKN